MTARPFTKDQIEAMRNGLMTDMKLRMGAYHILKSGDLKKLDALVPSPLGGPDVSYREILDYWKKELESPAGPFPVPTFLKRLGVDYSWNGGAKDYSDAIVACPIDFSLLGLDPKKIPDLSHLRFVTTQKKDLEELWQPTIRRSWDRPINPEYKKWVESGKPINPRMGLMPAPYDFWETNLRSTLKKGSETTISTKGKSRSR